jgi:hypothetical protein
VGKKYQWSKGIGEGISSYTKAYSKWEYTKKSMDIWAERLKATLDELAGKRLETPASPAEPGHAQ